MHRYGFPEADLHYLPDVISDADIGLEAQFQTVFGSADARQANSVVYLFLSERPVPRVQGASRILYIGKTKATLHARYYRYAGKLASQRNGAFYRHIIATYGAIRIAYLRTAAPEQLERELFRNYLSQHLEYPPKSKVG